jgi:hypothetical protein
LAETAVPVRQMVWSSFGSYHLDNFLFERILGIIVFTGRVAAPGGSHKDIISFVLLESKVIVN